jgi:hypothetical protein
MTDWNKHVEPVDFIGRDIEVGSIITREEYLLATTQAACQCCRAPFEMLSDEDGDLRVAYELDLHIMERGETSSEYVRVCSVCELEFRAMLGTRADQDRALGELEIARAS